jgi:outer membrane lipoprotein carrier protein
MKYILPLAMTLLLMLPMVCLAQKETIDLSDVIESLEKPFRTNTAGKAAIRDFEADFFQVSTLTSLDREQRGRGRVQIRFVQQADARESVAQFRWEYDQPNKQEIVSDGRTLWVYIPENHQVIESKIEITGAASADDPMTFLTGLGNLSRDFSIHWASPNQDRAGNYVLQLQPRRISAMIRELQIVVDREAVFDLIRNQVAGRRLPILSSQVTDPNGNSTLIEFSNAQVNRGLSGASFRFSPPAGVDIVHPTGQDLGY